MAKSAARLFQCPAHIIYQFPTHTSSNITNGQVPCNDTQYITAHKRCWKPKKSGKKPSLGDACCAARPLSAVSPAVAGAGLIVMQGWSGSSSICWRSYVPGLWRTQILPHRAAAAARHDDSTRSGCWRFLASGPYTERNIPECSGRFW